MKQSNSSLPLAPATVRGGRPARLGRLKRLFQRDGGDSLQPSIFGFILQHSLWDQVFLVVLTLVSFPFLYYSLDLPKTIINRAIGGKHFPEVIFGFQFSQIPYLGLLCLVFLALVVINGWFKWYINVKKGQTGERMLRRLRFELYQRVLRFPMQQFNRISAGEVIAMITAELEPLGGFIGDAFSLPIFQGGTLLTILFFMFVQDPVLGAAAIALYPMQGYIIPKLQKRVRALGRERVRTARTLSDRIGETIAGRVDIRVNDAVAYQSADIGNRLGRIYDIRFEIYNRKYFVKFLNNFINQLTPFFFYAIGGYLVIRGSLSFGALVAVLAAYKDLSGPWKELLDFYQNQQDVAIKYEQVVEQFQVPDMIDRRLLVEQPPRIEPFKGEVAISSLSFTDHDGVHVLEGVSVTFQIGEHLAVVGNSASGKNMLPQLVARLAPPSSGRITIGGVDINTLPMTVTGRRLGYVGPAPHLFSTTLRENLLLGLEHQPLREPAYDAAAKKQRERAVLEAQLSGNPADDIGADWIDYEQAGVADADGLTRRIIEVLHLVELEEDVYALGLRGRLDPKRHPDAAERALEARRLLHKRLAETGMERLVERFDPHRYNSNASVAENLLFGTPIGTPLDAEGLPRDAYALGVLDQVGLTPDLVRIGAQVAETMVELFADVSPDHEFFAEFSFISAEDLPQFEAILGRLKKSGSDNPTPEDRQRLLSLAFKLVAARHRLGLIEEPIQERILQARAAFAAGLPEKLKGAVEFFDEARYNSAATLQENILFGTTAHGEAESRERLRAVIAEVLDTLGLRDTVIKIGLDYHVGTGGSRLSLAQRQKAAIARAVLKRPDLLVLNEATVALDGSSQIAILEGLRREFEGRSLFWSLHRASQARQFDRVLVMSHGRVAGQGRYEELERPDSAMAVLMAAE